MEESATEIERVYRDAAMKKVAEDEAGDGDGEITICNEAAERRATRPLRSRSSCPCADMGCRTSSMQVPEPPEDSSRRTAGACVRGLCSCDAP